MNENHFRIIFQGLTEQAKLQKLALFFHRELGLSEDRIRGLLTSPPRVLWQVPTGDDAALIQEALEKLGCRTVVEPLASHAPYPFSLSRQDHETIKRELSKVLRVKSNLTLFLVQVDPLASDGVVPSLMGDARGRLEEVFRDSDTVMAIDDSRAVILGFSTNGDGVHHVHRKVTETLTAALGTDKRTSMGHALFPHEAQSLMGLLETAEARRRQQAEHEGGPTAEAPATASAGSGEASPADHYILKARGKAFKRLTDMPPDTLRLGLRACSPKQVSRFLARLPIDSPLVAVLEAMIDDGTQSTGDEQAEQHLEAIIHQLQLDMGGQDGGNQRKREILDRLKNADALPTLPAIAAHIFKIASDSASSAQDITQVIVNDPPLTSKLLKMVNSAFYGFPQKISTVKQAVVILGTEEIIDLSFGLAAAKAFEVDPVEGLGDPKHLWRHSIGTGFIAQDLCKGLNKFQNLGAFTAGLLHDFGKIFLMDNYPESYARISLDSVKTGVALFESEAEWLHLTHAYIGRSLATGWNLPEGLTEAIAFHHEPFKAGTHPEFAAVVGLADHLYYQTRQALESDIHKYTGPCPLTVGHWRILEGLFHRLDGNRLEEMVSRADRVMEESEDIFSLLEE